MRHLGPTEMCTSTVTAMASAVLGARDARSLAMCQCDNAALSTLAFRMFWVVSHVPCVMREMDDVLRSSIPRNRVWMSCHCGVSHRVAVCAVCGHVRASQLSCGLRTIHEHLSERMYEGRFCAGSCWISKWSQPLHKRYVRMPKACPINIDLREA